MMKDIDIEGVIRGKKPKTTLQDKALPCPLDQVNRQFHAPAPNVLWVNDFAYVATWQGFVYVAFVIDVYARCVVGWCASPTANAGFVLDALEQAIHQRRPAQEQLVHHSDRGSQYLSITYTERLADAKIAPSLGGVGDSYDNALAETINGLFEAEVIHRRGPWRSFEAVEYATLEWVDWFNNRRLLEPIGNIPPAEAEANYCAALERSDMAALLRQISLRQTRYGSVPLRVQTCIAFLTTNERHLRYRYMPKASATQNFKATPRPGVILKDIGYQRQHLALNGVSEAGFSQISVQ